MLLKCCYQNNGGNKFQELIIKEEASFRNIIGEGMFGWLHFYSILLKLHVICINKSKMFVVLYHIFKCSTDWFVLRPQLLRIAHLGPIQDNLTVTQCDFENGWRRGNYLQYHVWWHLIMWIWWYTKIQIVRYWYFLFFHLFPKMKQFILVWSMWRGSA